MRALSLRGPSLDDLAEVELPDPPRPGHGQILVRMRAASLNFIDLAVATGQYPGVTYPLVPVADGAGEVVEIGEGESVSGLKIGDRVALHPKALWIAGRGTAENGAAMRGLSLPGSLREIATADAASVVKIADHLSWEAAATLPIAATTAWNALAAADAGPGATVVLLGTGGVSIFGLQLAKARGARVIITSSSDSKLERARSLGADETINYGTSPDWDAEVKRLTAGRGADLILETVGSDTFARSVAAVRQGGVIFTIGFITGTTLELDLMPVIVKAVRVQGNNTGSVQDFSQAMQAIDAARIEPVVDRIFGIDEVGEAYRLLSRGGFFGKIAIRLDW
ncbi:alcohol dehydrogenase [Sphingomonas oleivorans]|uniref:Alcohol dehydrogenase n=1 Tax=Sphingomonas oleivorans TaxID=1735121 RepID=A0A2T5FWL7_9SPHN|nr:NAD(P)-dependent alcohol dehydrogenase [Sphingomonas oleivorans]PTQ10168.1 alcohol dehydrogenase [Sphingomonas oleivorans]